MTAPRRRTTVTAIVAVAVALGLGVAGCSDGGDPAPPPAGAVAGSGPSTTLARTVTGSVDLRRLVVTTAPAGHDLLPSPPYGAVDLNRLLADFSDAPQEDEVILEETRFKRGYTRGWLREDPRSFFAVFVFEFDDEDGARAARDRFAAQNVARKGATPFTVDGIADAAGQSYTRQVEGEAPERTHVVTFVRGSRLYQVGGQFADLTASVDATVDFARTEAEIAA